MVDQEEIVRQLRALQDVEEINKLKARYVEACDGGWGGRASHDPDKITSLFTDDCVWDGGSYGNRQGRAALRDYYVEIDPAVRPSAFHILSNPVIDIDGDLATGKWHLTILLTMVDQSSMIVCGEFDDMYQRTPAGWRIHKSSFTRALTGKYDAAWEFAEGSQSRS